MRTSRSGKVLGRLTKLLGLYDQAQAARLGLNIWQEVAGIQQPRRQPKLDFTPIPAAEPDGKVDIPLPLLPGNTPFLEEGLHRALPGMPPQVAAFLLHVPRDPPAWRYQESEGERAERQALENLGLGPVEPRPIRGAA